MSSKIKTDNTLLPSWFTERMMSEVSNYGLLTVTGDILEIARINKITRDDIGNLWIDGEMFNYHVCGSNDERIASKILIDPTERTNISISVTKVSSGF